jgi:cytochrome P450
MSQGAVVDHVDRVPDHVPPELVRDFSYWTSPGMAPEPNGDPHAAFRGFRDGPRVFYAHSTDNSLYVRNNGMWIFTRAADMREALQKTELFSSVRDTFASMIGESWAMVPVEIDPPLHTAFRMMLNPLFSPKRIEQMKTGIRERAVGLIEGFKARGECEFMSEFARPFPVTVFLQFVGLSDDRREEFQQWGRDLLHGSDFETKAGGVRAIVDYMRELIADRRKNPKDDFITFTMNGKVDGRPLTEDEIVGCTFLVFLAGLDTVAATLSFLYLHLARHPEHQAELRANPALIPAAVEELMRVYGILPMSRIVTRDLEFAGVKMKKGDMISCPPQLANIDRDEVAEADQIDFTRTDNRHMGFAYGPHRCIGSHLARLELTIAFEEWLGRLSPFRIKEGCPPVVHAGTVWGADELQLAWG